MKVAFFALTALFLAWMMPTQGYGTTDILSYHIELTFKEMSEERIAGFTDIHFRRLNKENNLRLELLDLKVDRVEYQGQKLPFKHEDSRLTVNLPSKFPTDTATVRVYYAGTPGKPSWFGGIYFSKDFIYNLGVAIDRIPHCYGKVWFPCVDNFTDKATYSFKFRVPAGKTAVCNGTMTQKETHPDGTASFSWKLRDPIPTYLASFAIGDYVSVDDVFKGIRGEIPISIFVAPGKEDAARGSFRNLKKALAWFEQNFGPYEWERVGYVAVPMTGGAMEHATNIAYPKNFVDSTLKNDRLWAHELAHSWFGNLVTCADAGDMWLNEGFARWAEAFYNEMLEGKDSYQKYMRKIVYDVHTRTHLRDEGYFAVAGISEKNTYGSTVYDKGSLIVHTLRGQMGDSAFFKGIKFYMNKYRFGNATTTTFRETMEESSGQKLENYFKTWILSPGYIFLDCDEMTSIPHHVGGKYLISTAINQHLIEKPEAPEGMKLEVLFLGKTKEERHLQTVILRGKKTKISLVLPFMPTGIVLDPNDLMSDASAQSIIDLALGTTFETPGCTLTTTEMNISRELHLRYALTPPAAPFDEHFSVGIRYWEFAFPGTDNASVKTRFNIRLKDFFYSKTFEQYTLNKDDRKALALLYRRSPSSDWEILQEITPDQYMQIYSADSPLTIDNPAGLKAGQYTVGFVLKK